MPPEMLSFDRIIVRVNSWLKGCRGAQMAGQWETGVGIDTTPTSSV